jgi:hypothetical protein
VFVFSLHDDRMSPLFPLRAFSKVGQLFEFRTHPASVIRVETKVAFAFPQALTMLPNVRYRTFAPKKIKEVLYY